MILMWQILLKHILQQERQDKAVDNGTAIFADHYYEKLDYYLKQDPYIISSAEFEIQTAIQYTSRVANACARYGKKEMAMR